MFYVTLNDFSTKMRMKTHMQSLFLEQQNQPFATPSLLHTKTAIKNLFRTVIRIEIFCTEAEINQFFNEHLTWYTLPQN